MIRRISALLLLYGTLHSLQAEKHSLYYIYTGLSKPVNLSGIYEYSTLGLLDDRQIDYYNSEDKINIPKQQWMKEKMPEDYWKIGTESGRAAEEPFTENLNFVMKEMNHSKSDLHVLQLRYGCEVEQQGDEVKFTKGISEYGYDGEDFLYFDIKESQWVALVEAALPTKRKWDNIPILNQYLKGYLEEECVYWLKMFSKYADEELRNGSLPDVHVFARKSYKTKLKLSCLATGFFPKDVMLSIRKYNTSVPDDEVESTGVRPNHDGSFQKRISVEIKEDDKAEYDCFLFHRTLKEPIIFKWDGKCWDCPSETVIAVITAAVIGGVLLSVLAVVVFFLKKKGITGRERDEAMADGRATGSLRSFHMVTVGPAGRDTDSGAADGSSSHSSVTDCSQA